MNIAGDWYQGTSPGKYQYHCLLSVTKDIRNTCFLIGCQYIFFAFSSCFVFHLTFVLYLLIEMLCISN